jgi:hypothetical protein
MGTLRLIDIEGLRVLRHFTLIYPAGPEPQGPAAAFRRFALERRNLLMPPVNGSKGAPDRSSRRPHKRN